jgi:DNA repair exonuclease SbcCD ATPase subunit
MLRLKSGQKPFDNIRLKNYLINKYDFDKTEIEKITLKLEEYNQSEYGPITLNDFIKYTETKTKQTFSPRNTFIRTVHDLNNGRLSKNIQSFLDDYSTDEEEFSDDEAEIWYELENQTDWEEAINELSNVNVYPPYNES